MHSRVRLASIPIAVPTVLFHWPSLAPGLRQGTCRWSCALDRQPVALGQSALPSTGAWGSNRGKKKKKRMAIYLALWPGPAAVSLLSIAPFSSRRPLPSRASLPTSVPSRRPPSSPFVPSAACWLGATTCHPSPVEAQTLQQSTNLLPASCKSLPPRRQLHSWARTASKLAGAVSRAKKSTVLGTCTCRRAIWGGAGRPTQGLGLDKGPRGVPARRGWISVAPGFVRWGQGEVVMDDGR